MKNNHKTSIINFFTEGKHNNKLLIVGVLFLSVLMTKPLFANNLVIGAPTSSGTNALSFTIQWDNSWNVASGPSNWDGVWLFVKRQDCADNKWKHALSSTVDADHSITGGILQVDAVTDGMGVFVRRTNSGFGNNAAATITLELQNATATDNFKVFGIEVVSVPEGDFYLGDGTRGRSNYGFSGPSPFNPILITNTIQTAGLGVAANYQQNTFGSQGSLPGTFPLGWNKFYSMKYEISQGQYASFLNTLSFDQQSIRTSASPSDAIGTLAIADPIASRNDIKIIASGTINNIPAIYESSTPSVACNWLNWADLTAYLDWSALRPMTEFEYEKICRGPNPAFPEENAWGTINLLKAESSALNNAGLSNETSNVSGFGLCAYGANTTTSGPLRCGFAATGSSTRIESGASFYGAMEMSGNVNEQCVGGYNFNFSAFTTANGDGELSSVGSANTPNWPVLGGGRNGGILKGSNWHTNSVTELNVSDRFSMVSSINQVRDYRIGGRGVRNF